MSASRAFVGIPIAVLLFSTWIYAQPDLLRQGIALMNASRPLEAEEVLKSVTESHPAYHSARILLGFLFSSAPHLSTPSRRFAASSMRILAMRLPD